MTRDGASTLEPGTLLAQRFTIQRALGRGGMSKVYEAWDVRLRQRVAVKVLSPRFTGDAGAVERFLREARAVVRLRNQHVVRVIDVGALDVGTPYLVMEFLDGQSVARLLAKNGRFAADTVVDYTLQSLEALAEAHRAGMVHRDLKPDNLMLVQSEDGLPQIKVIDFGVSKLMGSEFTLRNLTLERSFLGSPLYASPEQLQDSGKVDARTDIWSLGAVMYELLAGRPPFDGVSAAAIMAAVCMAEPPRIEDQNPAVPAALVAVVRRCLQKRPEDRYANVQELALALGPLASDARARLSVEHVVRVSSASSAPPSLEEQTTPSMPPTSSSVTVAPEARLVLPRARKRPFGLALAGVAFAGLFASLFAYARLSPPAREAGAAAQLSETARLSPPIAASAEPAPVSPALGGSETAAREAPRTSIGAAHAASASPARAVPPTKPLPEASPVAPTGRSSSFSVPLTRTLRPARPLDSSNPFAR